MNLITLLFVVFLLGPSLSKGRRGGRLSKAEQSIGSSVRHRRGPVTNKKATNCSLEEERDTFLWRIDTKPPSYFFGTIHVPYTRVWDAVSTNTKKAFHATDRVYFELDLTNPYTIAALTSCQLLPRGLNLSQVLPPDVYTRLRGHLAWVKEQMSGWVTNQQRNRGLHPDYLYSAITGNWERKRPVWAMLMVNGLTKGDIASRGFPVLDLYLAQMAAKLKKKVGAVERVEEQCQPLNGLTYGQVIFALNQTLQLQKDVRQGNTTPQFTTEDLIKNYRCGNLNSVVFNRDTTQVPLLTARSRLDMGEEKIANEIDEYFRDQLIYKRNKRMGARVIELLLNNPGQSFFFAFGAGHFVGEHTILDVVRKAGFRVDQVEVTDDLSTWHQADGQPKGNVPRPPNGGTVMGTIDDLSDDEKTRAFLQLLEYKLRMEKEQRAESEETGQKDSSFHELWQRLPAHEINPVSETDEEKTVRESIQVWYGINTSSRTNRSPLLVFVCISLRWISQKFV